MKEKYGSLEKIIFFVLLCFLLVAIPFLLRDIGVQNEMLKGKMQRLSVPSSNSKEGLPGLTATEEDFCQNEQTSRTLSSLTSKRNIFTRQVHSKNVKIVAGGRTI